MAVIMYRGKAYGGGSGGGGGLTIIPKTKVEYEALTEEEKLREDVIYEITDQVGGVKFGSTDISGVGDGTVTGAISGLNGKIPKFTFLQPSAENVKTITNIGVDYSTLSEKTIIASFLIGVAGYNSTAQITRVIPQPMSGNKVGEVLVECSVAQKVLVTIGVLYTD